MNKSNHVNVTSVDEYFNLPREKREKWGFWYLKPIALPLGNLDEYDVEDGGWNEFDSRICRGYPIQSLIRYNFSSMWEYFFGGSFGVFTQLQYRVSCFFFPRNQDLRDAIPKTWRDKPELITDFLFACIKSFVEEEDGLSQLRMMDEGKKKLAKLKSRKISKEERVKLNAEFKDDWQGISGFNDYCGARYESYVKINEIYIYATKTRVQYNLYLNKGQDVIDTCGEIIPWGVAADFIEEKDGLCIQSVLDVRGHLWS